MRKEQNGELARIVLYSACSLIVGCAVGGALLMKIAVQGNALNTKKTAEPVPENMPVVTSLPQEIPAQEAMLC